MSKQVSVRGGIGGVEGKTEEVEEEENKREVAERGGEENLKGCRRKEDGRSSGKEEDGKDEVQ